MLIIVKAKGIFKFLPIKKPSRVEKAFLFLIFGGDTEKG